MTDDQDNNNQWTDAERAGVRTLLRMAGILFLGIIIAGVLASLLSLALETL